MTVIAGVSLFDGVMLLADTRVTAQRSGKILVSSDIAQKLIPITNRVVVGLAGDVVTAGAILWKAAAGIQMRTRKDPYSVLTWLFRLMRHEYQRLEQEGRAAYVKFLIGCVLTDRPNVVERQKVVDLMNKIMREPSIQRSWMPDILVRILMTDARARLVVLPGTSLGLIYTADAPDFEPRVLSPLEYVAIGSGSGATEEIRKNADWIFGGATDDHSIRIALSMTVEAFLADQQAIADVGGMFPCVKLDRRGATLMGGEYGSIGQGHPKPYKLSLSVDAKTRRWVQQNHLTGKRIQLAYPWEIGAEMLRGHLRFDDLKDALNLG